MNAHRPASAARRLSGAALATLAATLLAGCAGGTPWGATPQRLPEIPLPNIQTVPAVIDASTTSGSERLAERVRAALAAQPRLAGAGLTVNGLEGGVIILAGAPATPDDRALAMSTARQVPGVSNVVDRMTPAR